MNIHCNYCTVSVSCSIQLKVLYNQNDELYSYQIVSCVG